MISDGSGDTTPDEHEQPDPSDWRSFDRWIELLDGVRLHATIWLPLDADTHPVACLLEALPYRKDDVTASYADTYEDLVVDGGFAVCRVDLRGTGSSSGIATDEYPDDEIDDLRTVIGWLAAQPWCTGRIGMFGTSYSGFNSLHLAAAGVPALGAVCAMYSTDDRYTDDVHYTGGALRAIDLIDYVTYMVAMNALPPVPAIWGDGWVDEWRHRVEHTPPWIVEWLSNQTDGPTWRRGSIRLGPDGAGYERIDCPTMLVAGWADGYRNNTFRTVERLHVPWRLLLGPWSHQQPDTARPGPNLAFLPEMIAWFDEHLRGGPARHADPVQVYVRHWTPPSPDTATINGEWRSEPADVLAHNVTLTHSLAIEGRPPVESLRIRPDTGTAAWISCAGALPWGQPVDQRGDDAWSIVTDWPVADPIEILGHPRLTLRIRADEPVAFVSAKLSAVAPDGTSALATRGFLNLCHRNTWPASPIGVAGRDPEALEPGKWYDVVLELEATSWRFDPGQRLRLAIAGTDWPNLWPPPRPLTIEVDRTESTLHLPTVPSRHRPAPLFDDGPGPDPVDPDAVWRIEHDVLGRETRAITRYGDTYPGNHGALTTDRYDGVVTVSTVDPGRAAAHGTADFTLSWPEANCRAVSEITVVSNESDYTLAITLQTSLDGAPFAERRWHHTIPRRLQ